MYRRYLFIPLVALLVTAQALGQSPEWQQRVDYQIDVHLQADRHRMAGTEEVTYYNNSPDTLHTVYYHLYFNAFQPRSMMAERSRQLPDPDSRVVPRIFNLDPDEIGFYDITSLRQDGASLSFDVFDTVLEADLAEPIPPGDSTVFSLEFTSQVPLQTRRSGRDNREGIDYSMSQWYPKIAAYDEDGWHADPYVGREFYAPFGSFDVQITLPSSYVIGATGTLQNPDEIGHGYDSDSTAGPATPGDSLTWHFTADNVHDFAWAADPDFVHDSFMGPDGTRIHLLYQPRVADTWKLMHGWVPEIMNFYNDAYGTYPYPQFTAIQAGDGGMEYPQIVFLTGRRSPPSLRGVTAHEMGHQWFYGVLATNEADFAWMDEGFTTYADTEVTHHLQGRPGPANHLNSYLNVIYAQELGLFERLNTPADWFETNLGYGIASYPGGAMVVDMLGGVISDSLRDRWLQQYYSEYQFRHPQPRDVERLAEEVSDLRLDWFFEQWTDMTRACDYAASGLESSPSDDGFATIVTISRRAPAVMPVDVRLTMADGRYRWVNIPLSIMQGHKPVPETWTVADPWGWTNPNYTLELTTDERVVEAVVDPSANLPDRNRLNNSTDFPLEPAFLQPPAQSYFNYPLGWRPSLHYAAGWGPGIGLQARGRYLFDDHQLYAGLKVWPQVMASGGDEPAVEVTDPDLSLLDGINYELSYRRRTDWFGPQTHVEVNLQNHLGIVQNQFNISRDLGTYAPLRDGERMLTVGLYHQNKYSDRLFAPQNGSLLWPDEHFVWTELSYRHGSSSDFVEASTELGTALDAAAERPFGTVSYNSLLRFNLRAQRTGMWGPVRPELRVSYGWGLERLAFQKQFQLSGPPLESGWNDDAFRSVAAAIENPREDAHLVAFPHAGPVAYVFDPTFLGGTPIGRQKIAATAAFRHTPFPGTSWFAPLSVELFAGVGTVWNETDGGLGNFVETRLNDLKADAGLGAAYDVSSLQPLERWIDQSSVLQGLEIAAKFPFWVSDPGMIGDESAVDNRWLIGIRVNS